jgi:protein-tyrosine phosphatase
VIGVALELLGVSDDEVDADYALSEAMLSAWASQAPANMMEDADWEQMVAAGLLSSPRGTMIGILQRLRREHGSVGNYLTSAGLEPDSITLLRHRLIEN